MTPRPAGLDLATLSALRAPRRSTDPIKAAIAEHLERWGGYVAFSTGKDSLVVLHLALQVDPTVPVVFFDSGLEYPETYPYLEALAQTWDLDLHVEYAQPSLLELLASQPSWARLPGVDHWERSLGEVLIDEPASRAHEKFGRGEIWGVRARESHGRAMAYQRGRRGAVCQHSPVCGPQERLERHAGQIHRLDGTRALGPIWDWTTTEVWAYIHRHQLPVHPAYAVLEGLGVPLERRRISHLLDAATLDNNAALILARGWPSLYNQLSAILPLLRQHT